MKKIIYIFLLATSFMCSKFNLEVISNQNGGEYLLDSGDIVFSGVKLKFSFSLDNTGLLKISSDDNISLYSKQLQQNKTYNFPEDGKELILDDNTGIEKFTFTLNGKTIKIFELKHIEKQVSEKVFKEIQDINNTTTLQVITFPSFDDREYTDLSQVKSNTRSATDKKVFKELSSPTIIIKSGQELGAGVLIDKKGTFLTNWHILKDQKSALIAFKPKIGNKPNKNNYYVAKVIQADPVKDLALLQLLNSEVVTDKNIKPITFSKMKNIDVGEDIYTIGHPVGYYYSLANGIIGNILNDHTWEAKGIHHKAKYIIKTQNQISGGNSGGPLVNKDLELLGLVTYSDTKGQNLNFAVSIEDIQDFLNTDHSVKTNTQTHVLTSNNLQETAYHTNNNTSISADITYAVDRKGNPIIIQRLDTNKNGIFDIIMIDTDKDGQWDKIGYDRDEDGIIEKWSSY